MTWGIVPAAGVCTGKDHVDTGTVEGYREAMQLLALPAAEAST